MIEADGDVTVHATAPVAAGPLCPACGRYARVWPSLIEPDGGFCGELGFHGFTYGEHGTIAALWGGMVVLAQRLRP